MAKRKTTLSETPSRNGRDRGGGFTPEELAAMAAADAEIEREFEIAVSEGFVRFMLEDETDRWLDEMAVLDLMDKKERHRYKYQRQYYEANREQIAEKKRQYYEANREQIAEKKRQYREANREQIAENQRQYYEANREQIADYQRQYREANREQIADYQRQYREARKKKPAGATNTDEPKSKDS